MDDERRTTEADERITREVVLEREPKRIWSALSKPEQLGQWLAPVVRIELEPGGDLYCAWPNEDDEAWGNVVTVEPLARLEFSWRSFGRATRDQVPEGVTTTVTFSLNAHSHGTLLVCMETGFDSVPPQVRNRAVADNELGWDDALAKLRHYLTQDEEDARETER